MSTGAIYIQANNDGQMDELLYMTGLLANRILEIKRNRMAQYQSLLAAGQDVSNFAITPTITDITMSHNLLPAKTYRPYVSTTFQYLKHKGNGGSGAQYNGDTTFTMRTFGEFLSDSVLHIVMGATTTTPVDLRTLVANSITSGINSSILPNDTITTYSGSVITTGVAAALGSATPNYPNGMTTAPATVTNYIWTYNSIEDSQGNTLMTRSAINAGSSTTVTSTTINTVYSTPILVSDYVRYAAFPMHALITAVKFQINSVNIDEYDQETDNFFLLYMLPINKLSSYYKCVGQEIPVTGYTGLVTNYTISSGMTWPIVTTTPAGQYGWSNGQTISARKQVSVCYGPQTPQLQQPALNCYYPNKFDHCRDVSNAIPVLAIPNTERTFVYTINAVANIIFPVPANLFQVTTTVTYTAGGNTSAAGLNPSYINTNIVRTPIPVGNTINYPTILVAELYINNLFIDPSIHDIYLERVGFSLTRVHKTSSYNVGTNDVTYGMPSFKWPLEFMFVGLRPSSNLVNPPSDPENVANNWYKFTYNIPMSGSEKAKSASAATTGLLGTSTGEAYCLQNSTTNSENINYYVQMPTITTIEVVLQSIPLYSEINADFYNTYMPYQYGNYNITGTSENSSLFITFNFYSNDNGSPNGHVNLSRSREFTLHITSNVVGSGNVSSTGVARQVGITCNFWIASAGNLYLRFT
jgi:hypothetical protein